MVTYSTSYAYAGDPCPQVHFTIPLATAKRLKAIFEHRDEWRLGDYWRRVLGSPLYRAVRSRASVVHVYTAGFSASELFECLADLGESFGVVSPLEHIRMGDSIHATA